MLKIFKKFSSLADVLFKNDRYNKEQGILSEEDLLLKTLLFLSKLNSFDILPSSAKKIIRQYRHELANNSNFNWEKNFPIIAKNFNLKVHQLTESLYDIKKILSNQTPILFFKSEGNLASPLVYVILSYKKGFYKITEMGDDIQTLISEEELLRVLGVTNINENLVLLSCEPDNRYQLNSDKLSSLKKSYNVFSQLFHLIRLEKQDIWVIVIYGIGIGILSLVIPIATSSLVNVVTFGVMLQPVLILTLLVIFFMSFAGAMQIFQTYVIEILQRRIFVRIALDFANRFPKMANESLDYHYKPELGNRFFDTFTIQKSIHSLLVEGLSVVLMGIIGFTLIAIYHPIFIVFDFFVLLIVGYIIIYKFGKKASKDYLKVSKQKFKIASWIEEVARHNNLFRTKSGSDFAFEKTDLLVKDYLTYREGYFKKFIQQVIGFVSLQVISNGILLGIGGYLVIERQLTIGQLVAAELVISKILFDISKFGKHLESYYSLLAAIEKVDNVLSLPLIPIHPNPFISNNRAIEVEFLDLEYIDQNKNKFFSDITFHITSGSALGLITNESRLKNVLFELMTGCRIPSQGSIFMDKQDIFHTDFFGNHNQTYLLKGMEIFEGEILENIQLGSGENSQSEIRNCLEKLNIWKTILKLPEGLLTSIATHGYPLDSSTLIMLQIARAVLAKPRLLIIDGILDDLPIDMQKRALEVLLEKKRFWTLLIYSKSNTVLSRMDSVLELSENMLELKKGKYKSNLNL